MKIALHALILFLLNACPALSMEKDPLIDSKRTALESAVDQARCNLNLAMKIPDQSALPHKNSYDIREENMKAAAKKLTQARQKLDAYTNPQKPLSCCIQ